MPTPVRVTRDVSAGDPHNYSNVFQPAGTTLYVFKGTTYGCVDTSVGIALTKCPNGGYPFFEFPRDAVEEIHGQAPSDLDGEDFR